jgi:D-aminoacyl-tRNA deacylase
VRLLLQRVARAEVRLAADDDRGAHDRGADGAPGGAIGRIGRGLLVFVGVGPRDGEAEVAWATERLLGLRVFADDRGKMNLDLLAVGGALLLVSQFTLYGDVRRGRRPGFSGAAAPESAERLYGALVQRLRDAGATVATGAFGQAMHVELVNDGPVTLWLDSDDSAIGRDRSPGRDR